MPGFKERNELIAAVTKLYSEVPPDVDLKVWEYNSVTLEKGDTFDADAQDAYEQVLSQATRNFITTVKEITDAGEALIKATRGSQRTVAEVLGPEGMWFEVVSGLIDKVNSYEESIRELPNVISEHPEWAECIPALRTNIDFYIGHLRSDFDEKKLQQKSFFFK